MKVFFDRFTDLLIEYKDIGRKFRGKRMSVCTTSSGDHSDCVFFTPFQKTAEYLGITFVQGNHFVNLENEKEGILKFTNSVIETR